MDPSLNSSGLLAQSLVPAEQSLVPAEVPYVARARLVGTTAVRRPNSCSESGERDLVPHTGFLLNILCISAAYTQSTQETHETHETGLMRALIGPPAAWHPLPAQITGFTRLFVIVSFEANTTLSGRRLPRSSSAD